MCDPVAEPVIESVVQNKVQNNEMFTAFDITVLAQEQLKQNGTFVYSSHRHRALRDDVHAIITRNTNGSYDRVLQDVGAPQDAFVYFPIGTDPSNYVPLQRKDDPAAAVVPSANPFTISITSVPVANPTVLSQPSVVADSVLVVDPVVDAKTCNADQRGTVCVSKVLIENAGMNPGDIAIAYAGKDDLNRDAVILVGRKNAAAVIANALATYTVDSHGNVRVNQGVFSTTNMVAANYDCEGNSTQVFIRPR